MNLKNPSLGLTVSGLSRCWLHEAITTVHTVDIIRKHLFLCFHVEKRRDRDTVHREAPAVTDSQRCHRPADQSLLQLPDRAQDGRGEGVVVCSTFGREA